MRRTRKTSAALTSILDSLNDRDLKRVEDRMLICLDIHHHMEELHITQTELAKRMGKTKSEVSEWLSGERNFTMDTLSDMYSALGIPMLNVLTAHVRMIASPVTEGIHSSDKAYSTFSGNSVNAYPLTA